MKRVILFLYFVLSSVLNINAGVESMTLVHTPQGLKAINVLSVGDEIICRTKELGKETRKITSIQTRHYESCIEVTTADNNIMHFSHDQRIFTPFKWTPVEYLSIGDTLMNDQQQFVRITSIAYKEEPINIYFIEVDEHENFMINESGILVHNGPVGATAGAAVGWAVPTLIFNGFYGAVGTGVSYVAGPIVGTAVGGTVRAVCLPAQVAVTKVTTLGGGIIGGTLTGPV